MSPRPAASVVIPTRDRPDQLARCLAAVHTALAPGDEVIVADSASVGAVSVAQAAGKLGARLVRVDLPGASRARNAGWRAARHDLVVFTDDDCLPDAGWVRAFVEAFAEAGPVVTFAWGRVTVAREGTGTAEHNDAGPRTARDGDDVGPLGASCNLAVRRSALEQVGGFDELLGAGTPLRAAEDKDLLLRLLAQTGEGVYVPGAVVEHEVWRSRMALVRLQHHYGIGAGALGAKIALTDGPVDVVFPGGLVRTHLRQTRTAVKDRYETGIAHGLARASGVWRGRRAARRMSVVDGHLHS